MTITLEVLGFSSQAQLWELVILALVSFTVGCLAGLVGLGMIPQVVSHWGF